jgi:hypothetical protein
MEKGRVDIADRTHYYPRGYSTRPYGGGSTRPTMEADMQRPVAWFDAALHTTPAPESKLAHGNIHDPICWDSKPEADQFCPASQSNRPILRY